MLLIKKAIIDSIKNRKEKPPQEKPLQEKLYCVGFECGFGNLNISIAEFQVINIINNKHIIVCGKCVGNVISSGQFYMVRSLDHQWWELEQQDDAYKKSLLDLKKNHPDYYHKMDYEEYFEALYESV